MEVWAGAPQTISGASSVRETFTISGGSEVPVGNVGVRVTRISGSDPLVLRLEAGDGTLIEQGSIPASLVPLGSPASDAWVNYTFATAHGLLSGQTYHVVIQSAASSSYQAFPIRKGSAYGFQSATYFNDGYAQFAQNGSWVGWTQWGVTNRTDGDLQFYLGLAAPGSIAPLISNATAGSTVSATFAWSTDQPSTSQVEYGTTTSYSNMTPVSTTMTTSHSVIVTGLASSTLYHYRVISTSTLGYQTISGDLTFTAQ